MQITKETKYMLADFLKKEEADNTQIAWKAVHLIESILESKDPKSTIMQAISGISVTPPKDAETRLKEQLQKQEEIEGYKQYDKYKDMEVSI